MSHILTGSMPQGCSPSTDLYPHNELGEDEAALSKNTNGSSSCLSLFSLCDLEPDENILIIHYLFNVRLKSDGDYGNELRGNNSERRGIIFHIDTAHV